MRIISFIMTDEVDIPKMAEHARHHFIPYFEAARAGMPLPVAPPLTSVQVCLGAGSSIRCRFWRW